MDASSRVDWELIAAPSAAVLATYRRNGEALLSPIWYRWHDDAFEVVIAEGDVKHRHLLRNPHCGLVVFEAIPPFRGLEVRGEAAFDSSAADEARRAITSRYLGGDAADRFTTRRAAVPSTVLRLKPQHVRAWHLGNLLEGLI